MSCFVCVPHQGPVKDGPGNWYEPRVACAVHKGEGVLPTGEKLDDFLMRSSLLVEGEAYSFLINPVSIRQQQGWLTFKFGGYVIWEDIFVSSSFSEWLLMNWDVDILYKVFSGVNGQEIGAVRELFYGWMYQFAVDQELKKRCTSFPRSAEEAYEILNSLPGLGTAAFLPKEEYDHLFLDRYRDLVVRRFPSFLS